MSGSSRLLRDNTAFVRRTNSSETGIWLKALIPLVCSAGSSADTLADFLISSSPAGRRSSAKTAAVLSFLKDLPPLVQPALLITAASKGDGTEPLAGELTERTPACHCIFQGRYGEKEHRLCTYAVLNSTVKSARHLGASAKEKLTPPRRLSYFGSIRSRE